MRTLARSFEIVNYLLLIPATLAVFVLSRGLFTHSVDFYWRYPEFLLVSPTLAIFYVLGLVFHLLYFQISRGQELFLPLSIRWVWGLSALFNLLLTSYFVFFGSFVAPVCVWTLCVAGLSLLAFLNTDRLNAASTDCTLRERATITDGDLGHQTNDHPA